MSVPHSTLFFIYIYTAISRKVVGKIVHATIPKGNMGYDQYTVPDDCSCRTYFCCFPLALENIFPWPFGPIPSNFFEERRTQNHPQCLLGWRALFPTTFLKIAVCIQCNVLSRNHAIECFRMTSRAPYWCSKTMKWRPCCVIQTSPGGVELYSYTKTFLCQ